MVAGVDMFTTGGTLPLHHQHHHHHQQHKLAGGSSSSTANTTATLLLQQHHRKLQLQQQEISEQILQLRTQVLQQQLEHLQQTKQQLKRELEQQQQQQSMLNAGGLLLNPLLPSLLPPQPPTPALLITATQSNLAANPRLEVARLNVFGGGHPLLSEAAVPLVPDIGGIWARSRAQLAECGWYHGCLSWQESDMLLENTAPGTFLVRDSQNPSCIYSLSVQRGPQLGGPTSIRIQFHGGRFALDAESDQIRRLMPAFNSVGELVEYYVGLSKNSSSSKEKQQQLMLDSCQQQQQQQQLQAPIVLRGPLYHQPPSLAHLCRLAVNRSLSSAAAASSAGSQLPLGGRVDELRLPPKLVSYLAAYTLSI
jgi:hypothetical protein